MRKWVFLALALVLLLVGGMLPVLFPRPSPVTREAFIRIKAGMTRAEVESILGGKPGDYRTTPAYALSGSGGGISWDIWSGDEGEVCVYFDGGMVNATEFYEAQPVDIGPVELGL